MGRTRQAEKGKEVESIRRTDRKPVHRLSISIAEPLAQALDRMVTEKGFANRSQAVSEMIEQRLAEHVQEDPEQVMAGTITCFIDSGKPGLLQKLKNIQREHIAEVISVQDVLLEGGYLMEVVLLQGKVKTLRRIADRMLTCKGVSSGSLTLTSKLLPPVQGRK